jgi:hypothetical protein
MSVAHEFGYFDQMHLIRDFHSLAGKAPTLVLQQIGDLQPWSLGRPMTPYDFPRTEFINTQSQMTRQIPSI